LFAAAERLAASGKPKPKIYIWCGTEDFLYDQNVRMRDHLRKLGFDLTYEESPGDHSWKYWDEKIQTVLEWLPINGERTA
jgi:S-formylglutathione hydrolase FrmB